MTFSVNFSIAFFSVAALYNLGSYLEIELVRRFQAKLVQHFSGKSIHMLQYLPLSEQPLDIHLVSYIIKKIPGARRKSRSSECNAIFPSSLLDHVINFFLAGEGERSFLCRQFLFLFDVVRNAFNRSLHGHCNNLIKIFHHDINIHKIFSCLLFQIFNTVIHSIAFAQNTFFFQVKTGQLPVFLLSALSLLLSSVGSGKAESS